MLIIPADREMSTLKKGLGFDVTSEMVGRAIVSAEVFTGEKGFITKLSLSGQPVLTKIMGEENIVDTGLPKEIEPNQWEIESVNVKARTFKCRLIAQTRPPAPAGFKYNEAGAIVPA